MRATIKQIPRQKESSGLRVRHNASGRPSYLQASVGLAPAPVLLNESKDHRLSHIWSHACCLKFPCGYQVTGLVPTGPLIIIHPTWLLLEQTLDRQCQEWYSMCLSQIVFEIGLLPFGWCWGICTFASWFLIYPFPQPCLPGPAGSRAQRARQ